MKHLLNTLYFSPTRDAMGRPASKYEGVIVAFTVRRDNGTEFEVREDKVPNSKPLSINAFKDLKAGDKVQLLTSAELYVVTQKFPDHGDVWLKHLETGANKAVKYTDLRLAL